ncbi:MAG: glycosyltransferase family 4 protein, partial [Candidatus Hodarchaeota archaeon]
IIFVGAFHPWHGVKQIVKIAEKCKNDSVKAKFIMVGKGPLHDSISKEIHDKDLSEFMILTGSVPHSEVPSYIDASDISIAPFFIFDYTPLVKYGFWWCPVKLFEYLAMEAPVITIDAGDIPFISPHGKAGLLSAPDDFDEMYQNLIKLIENKDLRVKLGKFGRKHVIKNYTWSRIANKIENIYRDI